MFSMRGTIIIGIFLLGLSPRLSYGQVWMSKNVTVNIFSETPLENIEAKTETAVAAFNEKTAKILVKIQIKSFVFPRKLMQEHFNENYLESDKYPIADFEGIIKNLPDFNANGTNQVSIKGTLTIHGVKREVELPATIIVSNNGVIGKSSFKVKCADYNIEIPKLVVKNIAEEIEIAILAEFKPIKK